MQDCMHIGETEVSRFEEWLNGGAPQNKKVKVSNPYGYALVFAVAVTCHGSTVQVK